MDNKHISESNQKLNISDINPDLDIIKKPNRPLEYYQKGLERGDKLILAEAITLVESKLPTKQKQAQDILEWAFQKNINQTIRIAITGSPGVGKSTFIEALGMYLLEQNKKVAVLSIDPSSQISKGSILGDKTRMSHLSHHFNAFVRPTASGTVLGGVAAHTKETILLCESAGYDYIIVETVGVGQSEVGVNAMTDLTILLLQPGSGDDLQGIKRGIMENADILVVNKCDANQVDLAKQTKMYYEQAIHYFHHEIVDWKIPVVTISSLEKIGFESINNLIAKFILKSKNLDLFTNKRKSQESIWFQAQITEMIHEIALTNETIKNEILNLKNSIDLNLISSTHAVRQIKNTILSVFNIK